jgi:hypothetical protein
MTDGGARSRGTRRRIRRGQLALAAGAQYELPGLAFAAPVLGPTPHPIDRLSGLVVAGSIAIAEELEGLRVMPRYRGMSSR